MTDNELLNELAQLVESYEGKERIHEPLRHYDVIADLFNIAHNMGRAGHFAELLRQKVSEMDAANC